MASSSSSKESQANKDKVAQATVKMWKRIGEAFRDWSKEVGAREVGNQVVDQLNEALDSVRKSAKQVGADLRARTGRKKKKKKNKSSSSSSKRKSGSKSKSKSKSSKRGKKRKSKGRSKKRSGGSKKKSSGGKKK